MELTNPEYRIDPKGAAASLSFSRALPINRSPKPSHQSQGSQTLREADA
jgi:hypothetical protein